MYLIIIRLTATSGSRYWILAGFYGTAMESLGGSSREATRNLDRILQGLYDMSQTNRTFVLMEDKHEQAEQRRQEEGT
jgi:hypothetical protein